MWNIHQKKNKTKQKKNILSSPTFIFRTSFYPWKTLVKSTTHSLLLPHPSPFVSFLLNLVLLFFSPHHQSFAGLPASRLASTFVLFSSFFFCSIALHRLAPKQSAFCFRRILLRSTACSLATSDPHTLPMHYCTWCIQNLIRSSECNQRSNDHFRTFAWRCYDDRMGKERQMNWGRWLHFQSDSKLIAAKVEVLGLACVVGDDELENKIEKVECEKRWRSNIANKPVQHLRHEWSQKKENEAK